MTGNFISRRSLLRGGVALGALGVAGNAGFAHAAASAVSKLPARGNFIIRNAHVMTMERDTGDIAEGSVHFKDGVIVAVGKDISAPGATAIDGRGMIVLPGLVETHWHMWNTLLRSMSGEKPEQGYFRTTSAIGAKYQPGDMYQGTRLAAMEAIHSGITYVHDFCHNIRGFDYAVEDLRALRETGIRARWSYGPGQGQPNDKVMNLDDLVRLKNDWAKYSNEGLIDLGFAWRGQGGNNPANKIPVEVWRAEINAARNMSLPITVHASGSRAVIGQIDGFIKAGVLEKGMQLIHAGFATPEELKAIAAAGAVVSLSPTSELRIGFGIQQITEYIDAGVLIGLSVDTVELTGNADMFGIMKFIQNVENGKRESEFKLSARRVLEMGTIEGARSMGVGDKIGSLKAGKRADIIMVDTRAPNMAIFGDPAHMIVTAAQPSNVDTVVIDGRILKRGGKLTAINAVQVANEANAASQAVRKRANWS